VKTTKAGSAVRSIKLGSVVNGTQGVICDQPTSATGTALKYTGTGLSYQVST
jgi:hypothetical protein